MDNETLEAPHSSSNLLYSYFSTPTSLLLLLYSYFSAKCTHCICFDMESTMVLNCFRVVISARMGKQMYFMPRENPEDEVEMKPKIICSTT